MAPGKSKRGKWKPAWGQSQAMIDATTSAESTASNPFGFSFTLSREAQANKETELSLFVTDPSSPFSDAQHVDSDHVVICLENALCDTGLQKHELCKTSFVLRNVDEAPPRTAGVCILGADDQSQRLHQPPFPGTLATADLSVPYKGCVTTRPITRDLVEESESVQALHESEGLPRIPKMACPEPDVKYLGVAKQDGQIHGKGPFTSSECDSSSSIEEPIVTKLQATSHKDRTEDIRVVKNPGEEGLLGREALSTSWSTLGEAGCEEAERKRELQRPLGAYQGPSHSQRANETSKSRWPLKPVTRKNFCSSTIAIDCDMESDAKSLLSSWDTEEKAAFEEAEIEREADRFLAGILVSADAVQSSTCFYEDTERTSRRQKERLHGRSEAKGETRRGIFKSSNIDGMGFKMHRYWGKAAASDHRAN